MQDQTSTHAGNILSSYGNPCKLDPVQVYATCMCLPKRKAKKHGHCRKNLRRLLTTIWQRKAVWKTSFFKQILRNYQPCVSTPKTPEQHKECVNQQNTVYHNSCPICFILQLWRKIPRTTMTSTVVYFGKHAMERNASTFTLWTWGGMLLKGLFLNNF